MDELQDQATDRKKPSTPEGQIEKNHKLLSKFRKLYLNDCKRSSRLQEVADRYQVHF